MSEKELRNEELLEQDVAEETVEEETAEEIVEEIVEEAEVIVEETADDEFGVKPQITYDEVVEPAKKDYKKSAIVAWALVAVLVLFDIGYYFVNFFNIYNHMGYLNVSGYEIGEIVSGMGMDFDEFKEMYGLPKNMKENTYMDVAQNYILVGKMAEIQGIDVETLKMTYGFSEDITAESRWKEAVEGLDLRTYVGEEAFEEFKEEYGLGDDVTLDTKWGEIRKIVEKVQYQQRIEDEKAAEEAKKQQAQEPEIEQDVADEIPDAE